jgi:hypothetical protein
VVVGSWAVIFSIAAMVAYWGATTPTYRERLESWRVEAKARGCVVDHYVGNRSGATAIYRCPDGSINEEGIWR